MDTETEAGLSGIGITEMEQRVYRAILGGRDASLTELVRALRSSPARVGQVLSALESKGLVSRTTGARPRYIPAPPDVAVEAILRRRQEELELARLAGRRLLEEFRSAVPTSDPAEVAELVIGREAIAQRFVQMQQVAEEDFMAFDTPPYAEPGGNPEEEVAIRKGVRYRVIYSREALEYPGRIEDLKEWTDSGEESRVLPDVPMKLDIADRNLALVPLNMYEPGVEAALLIHGSPLLEALRTLFELLWERAIPLHLADSPEAVTDVPDPEDRKILSLMAGGLKDEAIARQLGVTVRTVRRRISALMRILGAETRYQAGLQAARRGW